MLHNVIDQFVSPITPHILPTFGLDKRSQALTWVKLRRKIRKKSMREKRESVRQLDRELVISVPYKSLLAKS